MENQTNGGREKVHLDVHGAVALITLSSPETANAMDLEIGQALIGHLLKIKTGADVRVVVLTGAGRTFSAGANVKAIKKKLAQDKCSPSSVFTHFTDIFTQAVTLLMQLNQPVITAINGSAAGGGLALALSGDLVVASENADFDPAFLRLGLVPVGGLSMMLPLSMGFRRAAEFLFTARPVSAREALALGLVNRVTDQDKCLDAAMELAADIAAKPGSGVFRTKKLLRGAWNDLLKNQMIREQEALAECSETQEHRTIFEAFLERP
jgi:2-(1,2-epoxy-1,2-dihydrophenyl)acetyl-CoA isomerase